MDARIRGRNDGRMIDIDAELTARANDLLRDEPRLAAGAALLGMVAVLYREAKPEPTPKADKPAKGGKKPPVRMSVTDNTTTVTFDAGDLAAIGDLVGKMRDAAEGEDDQEVGPPATPSPWLKVATLAKADGLAKFKPDTFAASSPYARLNGGPILAKITVDGGLWDKLDDAGQRAALIDALRGLRHKARADGSDSAVVEKAPIRCWPDTAAEAQELMAALGPDGAQGAALTGALASSDEIENLDEAIAKFERRLAAGQDLSQHVRALGRFADRVMGLAVNGDENAEQEAA